MLILRERNVLVYVFIIHYTRRKKLYPGPRKRACYTTYCDVPPACMRVNSFVLENLSKHGFEPSILFLVDKYYFEVLHCFYMLSKTWLSSPSCACVNIFSMGSRNEMLM